MQFFDFLGCCTSMATELRFRLVDHQFRIAGNRLGPEQLEGEPDRVDMDAGEAANHQVKADDAPVVARLRDFGFDLLQQRLNDRHFVQEAAPSWQGRDIH